MTTPKPGRRPAGKAVGLLAGLALLAATCGRWAAAPPAEAPGRPTVQTLPTGVSQPPDPTAAPTVAQTATPAPLPLRRLTTGGCCPYPFWAADSSSVLFVDRPEGGVAGVYGVPVTGGEVTLFYPRPGLLSPDGAWLVAPAGELVVLENLVDGERRFLLTGGQRPLFSPSGDRLAWQVSALAVSQLDVRRAEVWVSQADGGGARPVIKVMGGGLVGWAGEEALLVSGRRGLGEAAGLWRVPLEGGEPSLLLEAARLFRPAVSPRGLWAAVTVAFAQEGERNGLWVLRTEGGEPRRLDLFGGYRWRSEGRLLVAVPAPGAPGALLWQVEADTGEARLLFDPARGSLLIANNDWAVSPDGRWMVFRSSGDGNLWLLALPES